MKPPVTSVMILALLFAGCAAPPPSADAPPPSMPGIRHVEAPPGIVPAMTPHAESFNFSGVATGAGDPNVTYVTNGTHIFYFPVGRGAVNLTAALQWSDAAGVADLDLFISSPSCDAGARRGTCLSNVGGSVGHPDSPAIIAFDAGSVPLEPGNWTYSAWAKAAVLQAFTGTVTVNYRLAPTVTQSLRWASSVARRVRSDRLWGPLAGQACRPSNAA